jgi:hypothetical protein
MPYTDLWRCKKCDVLPDIQMIGRHFLIACENCDKQKPVEGDSLDAVVSRWNTFNEPFQKKAGLVGQFQDWIGTLKDYVDYQRDCFRQKRERAQRLKKTVLEMKESDEENGDQLDLTPDLLDTQQEGQR